MQNVSRYVPAKVKKELIERANNFCECCGIDIPTDRHHILEFSEGGPTNAANLIVLCQSCHKQLPLFLDENQQSALQTWHTNRISNNRSATHSVHSSSNTFVIGSNTFIDCRSVLELNGQSILTPVEVNGRFYLNIVMLGNEYSDQMLVLGNRVIKNNSCKIETTEDSATVQVDDRVIFKIYSINDLVHINFEMSYKGYVFSATEHTSSYLRLNMTNCTVKRNGGAAIAFNLD